MEFNVVYQYAFGVGECVHVGPPRLGIGDSFEISDSETGRSTRVVYIEDVEYDGETDMTRYTFSNEPLQALDVVALFEQERMAEALEDENEDPLFT